MTYAETFENRTFRKCLKYAGTNSYTLFTLDKLIYKLVKQLQLILADDASMKLAELYRYERSRGGRVIDAVYYQNAHIILHEDSTFRFESSPKGPFTVQLLETDRSEVPAGIAPGVSPIPLLLTGSTMVSLCPAYAAAQNQAVWQAQACFWQVAEFRRSHARHDCLRHTCCAISEKA